jgi:hypothetical protein
VKFTNAGLKAAKTKVGSLATALPTSPRKATTLVALSLAATSA